MVSELITFVALYASQGHLGTVVREQRIEPGDYRLIAVMQAGAAKQNVYDLHLNLDDSADGKTWQRRTACTETRDMYAPSPAPVHFSCGAELKDLRERVRVEVRTGQCPVIVAVTLERMKAEAGMAFVQHGQLTGQSIRMPRPVRRGNLLVVVSKDDLPMPRVGCRVPWRVAGAGTRLWYCFEATRFTSFPVNGRDIVLSEFTRIVE